MASERAKGLTYAEAGVDIDAGNAMVEAIRPLVRATRRPGADAEIGGFGGLFDLKAAGFRDPVLVAANDGVGTKVKIAIEAAVRWGWDAVIGPDGEFVGMHGFGASAPAKDAYKHFGITAEAAVNAALKRLA